MLNWILTALCGYLCGSFNSAIVVSRALIGQDIRTLGSGNAGLTNAYRNLGAKRTGLVLLGDILKAVIALTVGGLLLGPAGELLAGAFVIVGHVFPLYFGFRGGKGVLVGATTLAVFDWRIFLVAIGLFIITVAITRFVSLGSILGAVSFPITMHLFYHNIAYTCVAIALASAVVYLHRANVKRLLAGTESKFKFKVKAVDAKPKQED